ncbi:MAG: pitrilysin family protein [Anaerolineales bacterium]|nr:pitrilysin family protein [Anaerolineales bacterium]
MQTSVTKLKLSNGLLVLLEEIHTAPIVSQWIWYRVGSRDERRGTTGISHWVEHMLFKGTPSFPAKVLDKAISRDGGYWNAMTFLDWTTYFETMPADKIDLALRLEADRMVNGLFEPQEVDSERTVIISERQGGENEPFFRLTEAIQMNAFQEHPYRHQVIGEMEDLQAIQRDDLYGHYRTFYVPNNAVLAMAGDFETAKMLERIRELFEVIPAGREPPRQKLSEPAQQGERRVSLEGPGETTYVQIVHHIPPASDPDILPLIICDSLLTGPSNLNIFGGGITNKTSRLYRALVEKELAISVQGGVTATVDPFLQSTTVIVHPQRKVAEVEQVVDDEIRRLQDSPPPREDLDRAVKQARAMFAYGSESITNQAFWLGFSEMFAHYDWFVDCLDNLAAVHPEDVQRVAQQFLEKQNRVVGVYTPKGDGADE